MYQTANDKKVRTLSAGMDVVTCANKKAIDCIAIIFLNKYSLSQFFSIKGTHLSL